jgi:hypothetical protein
MKSKSDDFVSTLMRAGEYYAVEIDHRNILFTGNNVPVARSHPLFVDLYDLRGTVALMSVPLHHSNTYYAVSQNGALAVVDGTSLDLYSPTH